MARDTNNHPNSNNNVSFSMESLLSREGEAATPMRNLRGGRGRGRGEGGGGGEGGYEAMWVPGPQFTREGFVVCFLNIIIKQYYETLLLPLLKMFQRDIRIVLHLL
jgi:hypothetical protein